MQPYRPAPNPENARMIIPNINAINLPPMTESRHLLEGGMESNREVDSWGWGGAGGSRPAFAATANCATADNCDDSVLGPDKDAMGQKQVFNPRNEEEEYVEILERMDGRSNSKYKCRACQKVFVGGPKKIRVHIIGRDICGSVRVQKCTNPDPEVKRKFEAIEDVQAAQSTEKKQKLQMFPDLLKDKAAPTVITSSGGSVLKKDKPDRKKRPVIIDTDAGVDDAIAILMLTRPQTLVTVVAVTTVSGSVPVEQATRNVSGLLSFVRRGYIRVHTGADSALIAKSDLAPRWPGHGGDGLGGVGLCEELLVDARPPRSMCAAAALIEMVSANPGEIELLALGPLTNIALAVKLDPSFASKVKHLTIMGGCDKARGNSSFTSEFNVHVDPEAAHIVLEAFTYELLSNGLQTEEWRPRITMLPWETCLENSMSWQVFDNLTPPHAASKHGALLKRVCTAFEQHVRRHESAKGLQDSSFCPCDAYAATLLEWPDTATGWKDVRCTVELGGTISRGLTAFDWNGISKLPPNVRLVQYFDKERLHTMLAQTFP